VKKPPAGGLFGSAIRRSDLLDRFEDLENRLRRADEHPLPGLAQATALEGIAAGTGTFSHNMLLRVMPGIERNE
jgi:hypothetical protein